MLTLKASSLRRRLLLSSMICGVAVAGAAQAQDAAPEAAVTELVVTGTRITRPDYVAASPTVSVTGEQLTRNADITLETYLNTLPQVNAGGTTTSNSPPNDGKANIDLRGLGSNRNLVLIDGRRPMVSSTSLTVDVNTIPQALIDSVEVLTGGAGSVYGPDAIAGVVNLKLKRNFNGVDLRASYANQLEDGDAQETQFQGVFGKNFDGGRGNVTLALEHSERDQLLKRQRDFSALASSTTNIPPEGALRWAATNPISEAAIDALFATYGVPASAVTSESGRFGFNPDGTLFYTGVFNSPLNVQNFRGPTAGINARYFPDLYSYNFDAGNLLVLPFERDSAMFNARYEFDGGMEVFGDFAWTSYSSTTAVAPTPVPTVTIRAPGFCAPTQVCSALVSPGSTVTGSLVVPTTNPFISNDLRTLLNTRVGNNAAIVGAGATEPFLYATRLTAFGLRESTFDNRVLQGLLGVRGPVPGSDTWTYEASWSRGSTKIENTQDGNVQTQLLSDVLANPATGAGGACATWNPFGANAMPQACVNALAVQTRTELQMDQEIAQGFLRGDVFSMPAGPVSVVLGAEYRNFDYKFDPGAAAGPISGLTVGARQGGSTTFKDVFGEAFLPIARDVALAQSLDLTLGYRHSKSQFEDEIARIKSPEKGSTTWKAELAWRPVEILRLRGSYQRAVRAPNFNELFQVGGSNPKFFDPCSVTSSARSGPNAAQLRALCVSAGLTGGIPAAGVDAFVATPGAQALVGLRGNPNLNPEKADTYSVGAVIQSPFESQWLSRFRASVDYYDIKVRDAILVPDVNVSIAACYNYYGGNPTYSRTSPYCSALVRTGDIAGFQNLADPTGLGAFGATNNGRIETSGLDMQVDYGFDMAWINQPRLGQVTLNLLVSHLIDYRLQDTPGVPALDYAGTVNYFGGGLSLGQSFPRWRATLNAGWNLDPVAVNVRGRYIGNMDNRSVVQFPGERSFTGTPDVMYWDAAGRWNVTRMVALSLGLNNIFDKQPPQYSPNVQSGTDPATFDVIGRRWFGQVNVRF